MTPFKQAILVGIDRDLSDFFKSQSRDYQKRISAVLHSYMETTQGRRA